MGLVLAAASSQYLTIPGAAVTLDNLLVHMWVRPTFAFGTSGTVYTFIDVDGVRYRVQKSTTANLIAINTDGRTSSPNVTGRFTNGVWTSLFIAIQKSGNVHQLYFDNDFANAGGAGTWGSTAIGTNLYIGAAVGPAQYFDGTIAELAIWSDRAALSSSQREQIANGTRASTFTTSLTGYWPLRANATAQVGGNNGTVQGGASFSATDHPPLKGFAGIGSGSGAIRAATPVT